jgi:hypothetical protein
MSGKFEPALLAPQYIEQLRVAYTTRTTSVDAPVFTIAKNQSAHKYTAYFARINRIACLLARPICLLWRKFLIGLKLHLVKLHSADVGIPEPTRVLRGLHCRENGATMKTPVKFSPGARERAGRIVSEVRADYPSQ